MSPEMQALHDAVKSLGDAALDVATALSAFEDAPGAVVELSAASAPLGDVSVAPDGRVVKHVRQKHFSYVSGRQLVSKDRIHKRLAATASAEGSGYDYKHWCAMVRAVRLERYDCSTHNFAAIMNVTESSVCSWELGASFASRRHRERIESLSETMYGVERSSWRKPKCD